MNIQSTIYKVFINVLVLAFVTKLFDVVIFPVDMFYLVSVYIVFSVAVLMHELILDFLTVKKVFLTRLITIALLVVLVFFLFELTFPGFVVSPYTFNSQKFDFITIESFSLSKYVTIILLGIISGFVSSLLIWLQDSDRQF